MAEMVEPGNKNIFGSTTMQASKDRCEMIIDKTKMLAFPEGPILSLENFESHGGGGMGHMNSVNDMVMESGKSIQESYRVGLSESQMYTEKVNDR